MASMNRYDKLSVLLYTPGLADRIKDICNDESTQTSYAVEAANMCVRDFGFEPFVDRHLILDVFNHYQDYTRKPVDVKESEVTLTYYDTQPANPVEENTPVSIKKVTYVNGMDINDMSVDQFLGAIKATDKEIKRLKEMEIDSATIDKQIKKLEEDKTKLVELLDEQHAND